MKNLILFIALSFGLSSVAQVERDQITTDFQKYSSAIKSKQYTQATNFMPDELFTVISKESLVKVMKQTFESEDTEVKINAVDITGFGEKITADDKGTYIPFQFNQKFDLKYLNLFDATDDEQSRNSTTKFIVSMLNESIPESTIAFDKKKEVFSIDSMKQALAIKKNGETSWKFIVMDPAFKGMINKIVPSTVVQKMKL